MISVDPLWSDEDWLLLLQLYLREPVGVKPLYGRQTVDLALELHVEPRHLYKAMFHLRQQDTPSLRHLVTTYAANKRKLARDCKRLRRMKGFGKAEEFYEGVALNESWEKDFMPVETDEGTAEAILPVQLIVILDLYFRLTPITMAPDTPEIIELGRLVHLKPRRIADIMDIYQFCDPYLNRADFMMDALLPACQEVWQRYGNDNPEELAALAAQLKEYFKG